MPHVSLPKRSEVDLVIRDPPNVIYTKHVNYITIKNSAMGFDYRYKRDSEVSRA